MPASDVVEAAFHEDSEPTQPDLLPCHAPARLSDDGKVGIDPLLNHERATDALANIPASIPTAVQVVCGHSAGAQPDNQVASKWDLCRGYGLGGSDDARPMAFWIRCTKAHYPIAADYRFVTHVCPKIGTDPRNVFADFANREGIDGCIEKKIRPASSFQYSNRVGLVLIDLLLSCQQT